MLLTDLQADVELLMECIKCQIHSPAAVKQALLTIASMCSTQGKLDVETTFTSKATTEKFILPKFFLSEHNLRISSI